MEGSSKMSQTFHNNYCMQPFEMRTTFCEIRLLNDTSQNHDTSFILSREEWGGGKLEGVRENGKSVGGGV